MDLKQIERLMAAMGRNGMKRLVIKEEGFEIELETLSSAVSGVSPSPIYLEERHPLPSAPALDEKKPIPEQKEGRFITSPMVGTFYASPSPEDPPFIKVGEGVSPNSVVCIIEAMKVMNEVKAGISGVIAEILVKNGDPIEFGTKLFRVT